MNQDRFDQWQELMGNWDALQADWQALTDNPQSAARDALDTKIDNLRARIGAFVSQSSAERTGISSDVRMGMLARQD